MKNIYKNVFLNKIMFILYLIVISIILFGIIMSKDIIEYIPNYISIYTNIIGVLFICGISIIMFLVLKHKIAIYLNNINFLIRFKSKSEWMKNIFDINIKLALLYVSILNIIPIIASLILNKMQFKIFDILYLFMYLISQILGFIIIAFLYDYVYFKIKYNKIMVEILIFAGIYIPTIIFNILRLEQFEQIPIPLELIYPKNNTNLITRLIYISILLVIYYFINKYVENEKIQKSNNDILWSS